MPASKKGRAHSCSCVHSVAILIGLADSCPVVDLWSIGEVQWRDNHQVAPHRLAFTTGPLLVATVFKFAAIVTLAAGIVATFQVAKSLSNSGTYTSSSRTWIILGTVAVTALVAATFAFFGYVLDLLREIRDKNDASK